MLVLPAPLELAIQKEGIDRAIYGEAPPLYVRVNPDGDLKDITKDGLEDRLASSLVALDWAGVFAMPELNDELEDSFQKGEVYVQDLSSMFPVFALDVQQGHQVADFCAAPGGKSLLIADLAPGAQVTSVESNEKRFGSLQENVKRYQKRNITPLHQDARKHRGSYDRILVDAPCPGDANTAQLIESEFRAYFLGDKLWRRNLSRARQLVEHAFTILKPGGTLVYSTCSFQTAYNEEVVGQLVENSNAVLRTFHQPGFRLWTPTHERMYRVHPLMNEHKTKGQFFAVVYKPE